MDGTDAARILISAVDHLVQMLRSYLPSLPEHDRVHLEREIEGLERIISRNQLRLRHD